MQKLLNLKETAGLIGVPVKTLYDWRHRGIGPTMIKVGRHLRIDPDDLDEWVQERRESPRPERSSPDDQAAPGGHRG